MDDSLWLLIIIGCSFALFIGWRFEKAERKEYLEQLKVQLELEERLSKAGIQDIDIMDGIEFEQYLVVIFKKLGILARKTKASSDFGADLILEGKERVVIQVKRYQKKVGIRAVQEVNSARDYYRAHEAWVITNNFFTTSAIKLAESTNVKLIDRYGLVDLILNSNYTSVEKEVR
ncbi:restriction endonuclease [Neobacillus drentensis]|uniref:restriction endonuclease n=1 Tax=Neobacillus drentensis TaxID=220684 RepID=UPI00285FD09C|nr:restriction endonuclease [Neobacillus drentensis]MDR7239147.1 restriction system protein [Neobacillus drentensis]